MALEYLKPSNPKETDTSFIGGLSKFNPAEADPEAMQNIQKATDEAIQALEHRYDNPNWFKVAAGFAKPQLGGFLASLGSASEALGENVEQQRANIEPLAKLKIEREIQNAGMGQRVKQNQLFQEWNQDGRPFDEQIIARIISLAPDSPVAKAASEFLTTAKQRLDVAGTAAGLVSKYPQLESGLKDMVAVMANPHEDPEKVKAVSDQYYKNLTSARPPSTDEKTWNSMSIQAKQDALYDYQQAQQKIGLGKEGEFRVTADDAIKRLPVMENIRDLALGKGLKDVTVKDKDGNLVTINGQQQMQKALDLFKGNNPFEVVGKAVTDGKFGELLKNGEQLVAQGILTKEAFDKYQELAKLLAANQVQLRNGAVNPTDAYTTLQQSSQPSLKNSQGALVGILDLMAHAEHNNIDNYKYIVDSGVDARHIGQNEGYHQRQVDYAKEHRNVAIGNYKGKKGTPLDTPDFYKPTAYLYQPSTPSSSNAPQSTAPTSNAPAPQSGGSLVQRLQAEVEARRKKGQP